MLLLMRIEFIKILLKKYLCVLAFVSGFSFGLDASEFESKLDLSARFDARHEKEPRYQYRLRWYPQYTFSNEQWSINGFAVTGNEFASSYNTISNSKTDRFNIRRLYIRHEDGKQKTEIGLLPTYKGRVSSTGLSKDGWIAGIRQVYPVSNDALIEFVVGELSNVNQSHGFEKLTKLNYLELEYSAEFSKHWSYELGLERMLDSNFIRGEVRYKTLDSTIYNLEIIDKMDTDKFKFVLSREGELELLSSNVEYFLYYSYVDDDFGGRAELTEDFIDTGHSLSFEMEGPLYENWNTEWFSKIVMNEGTSRFQLGIKLKI